MRFHVVSLPHTQTTEAYNVCAYTEKVRKFCRMMMERGHEVYLYAGEENEAPCSEHVVCISDEERRSALGGKFYVEGGFDPTEPHWVRFNSRVKLEMWLRIEPHDFICLIGGVAQKAVADFFPSHMAVEFGVGYGGTFSRYRVWESYAWMHTVYGAQGRNPHSLDGSWYDAVIPGYIEMEKFPLRARKSDYFLFVGRLTPRKGIGIAAEVCAHLGAQLVVAGPGTPPPGCHYVGVVDARQRAALMADARAVFVPTLYIEPFGNVAIEAMACGTPVITTDWGAFTETVEQGVTGFRCRSFRQFVEAAERVHTLNPLRIRKYADDRFSLEVVGRAYEAYFEHLSTLWGKGWYSGAEEEPRDGTCGEVGSPTDERGREGYSDRPN